MSWDFTHVTSRNSPPKNPQAFHRMTDKAMPASLTSVALDLAGE